MPNSERAARAHQAVLAYMGADGEFHLQDLLCDLNHWSDVYGKEWDAGQNVTVADACARGDAAYREEAV